MNGEEATTPDDLAAGDVDGKEGFVARDRAQGSVEASPKLPLLGGPRS